MQRPSPATLRRRWWWWWWYVIGGWVSRVVTRRSVLIVHMTGSELDGFSLQGQGATGYIRLSLCVVTSCTLLQDSCFQSTNSSSFSSLQLLWLWLGSRKQNLRAWSIYHSHYWSWFQRSQRITWNCIPMVTVVSVNKHTAVWKDFIRAKFIQTLPLSSRK